MGYRTERYITDDKGNKITVGSVVTIKYHNGGGCGSCLITKITDKGFRFTQGTGKEKSIQFDSVAELVIH